MMEAQAQYTERLSRQRPGLFVVLLDQSGSMQEPVEGEQLTKADYATAAVNDLIYTMCSEAGTDDNDKVKKLAYISVLRYNDDVRPLLVGPSGYGSEMPLDICYLSEHYLGIQDVQRSVYNQQRQDCDVILAQANYWIDPLTIGRTQMANALLKAQQIIQHWLDLNAPMPPLEPGQAPRNQCFPPVVINITDAELNGDGDPEAVAAAIRSLATAQGNCLIFTCHITKDRRQPVLFPSSPMELINLHPTAATMFNMSSMLPDLIREKSTKVTHGISVPPGARGFVYNADARVLAEFLRWGTKGTM